MLRLLVLRLGLTSALLLAAGGLQATDVPVNLFAFKLNGTPARAKADRIGCFSLMRVLTLTGALPNGRLVFEIGRDAFPKLPLTLPTSGQAEDVRVLYYPAGGDTPCYLSTEGTLTITRFDAAKRTVSGSFFCKANRLEPGRARPAPDDFVQLTEGTFTDVAFRKM